ncbi:GTP-binding protein [Streptomyces sp. NPDC051217]|uniref:GTP-binding protein n=1 Tax=Streptomyces sp. NPDC051217 TaxID=3365644 RepID=UPI00379CFFBE
MTALLPAAAARPATVNIGILAHVDAGKTTLTERLLFETHTIEQPGSVDEGTTQTDSDEIERRRGITIRTAVASFTYGSLQVNLIDTPGHAEFIAEVERALRVLDGAVLVVSAVEGVQPQTRILMRALRDMALPTLIFVNKIDRMGARAGDLLDDIRDALGVLTVPLNRPLGAGTRDARVTRVLHDADGVTDAAEVLAERDDELLAALVAGAPPEPAEVWPRLAAQVADGGVCPVVFGCARDGIGVVDLLETIDRTLPRAQGSGNSTPRGTVFAVERGGHGEKTGYLRLFGGRVRERERLTWHRLGEDGVDTYRGAVSGLDVVGGSHGDVLHPGGIARIRGIADLRVGDCLGGIEATDGVTRFPQPTLESVVSPRVPGQASHMHAALLELAAQDPLINARSLDGGGTSVLLYGEVQKEVIAERLRNQFGIEAVFNPSRIIYKERPVGTGSAQVEIGRSPFVAGIGLRVTAAPRGTGVQWSTETERGSLPQAFRTAVRETAYAALQQGLYGWPVTDCHITLVHNAFDNACSTGGDFRGLTPVVVMRALAKAGSAVFEPCHAFEVEFPADAISSVSALLSRAEARISSTLPRGGSWRISGELPVRSVTGCKTALPGVTQGEGVWWSRPEGDRAVRGATPRRARTDGNPLNPAEYMRSRVVGRKNGG